MPSLMEEVIMRTNLPCHPRRNPPARLEWGRAGVAELADALVLGTSSSECGFESRRPHEYRVVTGASVPRASASMAGAFRRTTAMETDSTVTLRVGFTSTPIGVTMSVSFADLNVPERLVARLSARGIHEAFPIQVAAIPDALAGRDIVGKAATGSGKTLAFGLPLLARLGRARPRKPLGLVLVPTRELAAQVQKELAQLTDDRGRRVICIYGGTSYNVARKALNFGVDVVVACPGRLEDMLEQGALDLSSIATVVVDEADRMADMGFLPAVRRIVGATPDSRHVMLFSATMGPDVKSLVKEFTNDAVIHDVVGEEAPSDVDHYFWRVPREQRPQITADIVEEYERALVFTRTKHGADRLARQLEERGISAVPLHGDRTQAQRERALRSVKNGQIRVLVATDVAARGIHIEELPVVIHYDPPAQAPDYLHRSGRTGRAGATGAVISHVGEGVIGQVKRLQRALGLESSIERREDATAIRLGAVDAAVAAGRLDDRGGKGRSERSNSRDSGPRNFE